MLIHQYYVDLPIDSVNSEGLGLIITGSVFYGTVTFQKKLGFYNTGSFAPQNKGQAQLYPPICITGHTPLFYAVV